MISVNVSFIGNDVKSLTVSGHANYDEYGKDIVCAGVSAIVTGGINALEPHIKNIEIITFTNEKYPYLLKQILYLNIKVHLLYQIL